MTSPFSTTICFRVAGYGIKWPGIAPIFCSSTGSTERSRAKKKKNCHKQPTNFRSYKWMKSVLRYRWTWRPLWLPSPASSEGGKEGPSSSDGTTFVDQLSDSSDRWSSPKCKAMLGRWSWATLTTVLTCHIVSEWPQLLILQRRNYGKDKQIIHTFLTSIQHTHQL